MPPSVEVDCGDEFRCLNTELLSVVSVEELGGDPESDFVSDVWGWTDPQTGGELVMVSLARGTSFVDISDPLAPVVIGFLPVPDTDELIPLQDIKVYADHAFIVGESASHGMQVVDLGAVMRDGIVAEVARYEDVLRAHNLAINEATGFAYLLGSSACSGGIVMVDITNPTDPLPAGCFDEDGYAHDAQCVIYDGPDLDYVDREVCFGSNEDTLTIVDVTDKSAPVLVSRTPYDEASYAHQGWLTEDSSHFFMGDELDEFEFESNTRTIVFEVVDLDSPEWIGNFVDDNGAINHNLFVVDGLMYQANYTAGLRVFDVGDPSSLAYDLVASIDTHPESDATDFAGAFGVFPFFESGTIAVSDISRGLVLVSLRFGS